MLSTVWLKHSILMCLHSHTHTSTILNTHTSKGPHTFTQPAARGCRSGLISVALTLIGACVPWLCVSLEYHAEPQSLSLPFTLPAGLFCSALCLSLLSPHNIALTPCALLFLLVLLSIFNSFPPQLVARHSLTGEHLINTARDWIWTRTDDTYISLHYSFPIWSSWILQYGMRLLGCLWHKTETN